MEKAYQALPGIPVTPMIDEKPMKSRGGAEPRARQRFHAPSSLGATSSRASVVTDLVDRRGRFTPAAWTTPVIGPSSSWICRTRP